MAIIAILSALIAGIGQIFGAVVDTGKAILDAIMSFLQTIFTILQSFVQSAPTPMKIFIFLFFLLTIGNIFSGFMLGIRYSCDSSNALYESDDFTKPLTLALRNQFTEMSSADRNTYIYENFNRVDPMSTPTKIKCSDAKPRLYFYSIDILSYPLWLLILVVVVGGPLIWNYYSRMGLLR